MKKEVRIIGIDDGPFSFQQKKVIVIGVVMRAAGYIEGVLRREVKIDGDDSTEVLIEMINSSRHHSQLNTIMLDGIALGGFNVVDIKKLHKETGIPVITVTRDEPDMKAIKSTLKRKFDDWSMRWSIIKDSKLYRIETNHNPIYITLEGADVEKAKEIIKLSTIRGVIPEPLRVAHLIASGVTRGESYGKA